MLPEFSGLSNELDGFLTFMLQERARTYTGPFAQTPVFVVHEGKGHTLMRADGSANEMQPSPIQSTMELNWSDIETGNLDAVYRAIDGAAMEMGNQMSAMVFRTLNESAQESGQTLDMKGKPLSPRTVLEGWSKIEMLFAENGAPHLPQMVVAPQLEEHADQVLRELWSEPKWRNELMALIERKREEWRDREADRTLAG